MTNKAFLMINLGTPTAPTPKAVGRYLKEFLTDPNVIDSPAIIRYPLVHGIIVPFRKKKSALNYQKVWMKEGSPLLHYSELLKTEVQHAMGEDSDTFLAMRYGSPSIKEVMKGLDQYDEIKILPLYPQYTKSSFQTAVDEVYRWAKKYRIEKKLSILPPFFDQDFYIDALVAQIKKQQTNEPDHYLFSYHGIPVHHLPACSPCETPCNFEKSNPECYRSQCFQTSRLIAKKLGLSSEKYTTAFQSRLGRREWIKPYTDYYLENLKERGIVNLTVLSPSFIVDCLETLEEIAIGYKKDFEDGNKRQIEYIPCINNSQIFARDMVDWIQTK